MIVNRTQLPPVGADPLFRFPAVDRHRLAAGLELCVVTHREAPVVTLMIVLPVGSSADPARAFGLATLTSDLLDEGAGSRRAIDLHDALARIGAQLDIDTGYDATVISLVTLSRHLGRAIELLADVAFRPRFDPGDVERVRTLRINRLRQLRDVPSACAEDAFARHLFGDGHPYGHLPMGSADALARLGPDDVRGFHAARFQASRAVLVATGDVAAADLVEAIARVLPAGPDEPSADELETPRFDDACTPKAGRIVLIDRPGAPQSELRVGCVAAARSTADYHAMVTMNAVLGGQFVSRINLNLREQKGYTYGARSGFEFRRAPGPFSVQASVQTSATAESVREVLSELRGIGSERPVTAAELDLARASLTRGYPRNFETAEQIARAVAQLVVYGLPDDYYDRFVPTIRAVDERAVTGAAAKWIDPDRMSVVIVGDRAAVEQPLAALGLGAPIVDA